MIKVFIPPAASLVVRDVTNDSEHSTTGGSTSYVVNKVFEICSLVFLSLTLLIFFLAIITACVKKRRKKLRSSNSAAHRVVPLTRWNLFRRRYASTILPTRQSIEPEGRKWPRVLDRMGDSVSPSQTTDIEMQVPDTTPRQHATDRNLLTFTRSPLSVHQERRERHHPAVSFQSTNLHLSFSIGTLSANTSVLQSELPVVPPPAYQEALSQQAPPTYATDDSDEDSVIDWYADEAEISEADVAWMSREHGP